MFQRFVLLLKSAYTYLINLLNKKCAMKLNYTNLLFGAFILSSLSLLLTSSNFKSTTKLQHCSINKKLNSGGAPVARTGAPDESNCTACHSGSVNDGNGINELIINSGGNEYNVGESTPMTLTLTEEAEKNGFQVVALHTNNEMAGTFTITDNTNTKTLSSGILERDYVTHTFDGTTQNSWGFDWETPEVGGDVTFYVATNKTNSSGTNGGDAIYLSQHTFTAPDFTGIKEEVFNHNFMIGYQSQKNAIEMQFEINEASNISFNMIDLSGKSVRFENLGRFIPGDYTELINLNSKVETGVYIATIFINNKPISKKIKVSK